MNQVCHQYPKPAYSTQAQVQQESMVEDCLRLSNTEIYQQANNLSLIKIGAKTDDSSEKAGRQFSYFKFTVFSPAACDVSTSQTYLRYPLKYVLSAQK